MLMLVLMYDGLNLYYPRRFPGVCLRCLFTIITARHNTSGHFLLSVSSSLGAPALQTCMTVPDGRDE
jgi:hypothetical protein